MLIKIVIVQNNASLKPWVDVAGGKHKRKIYGASDMVAQGKSDVVFLTQEPPTVDSSGSQTSQMPAQIMEVLREMNKMMTQNKLLTDRLDQQELKTASLRAVLVQFKAKQDSAFGSIDPDDNSPFSRYDMEEEDEDDYEEDDNEQEKEVINN